MLDTISLQRGNDKCVCEHDAPSMETISSPEALVAAMETFSDLDAAAQPAFDARMREQIGALSESERSALMSLLLARPGGGLLPMARAETKVLLPKLARAETKAFLHKYAEWNPG